MGKEKSILLCRGQNIFLHQQDEGVLRILNMYSKNTLNVVKRPAGVSRRLARINLREKSVTQICDLNLIISESLECKEQKNKDNTIGINMGPGVYSPLSFTSVPE